MNTANGFNSCWASGERVKGSQQRRKVSGMNTANGLMALITSFKSVYLYRTHVHAVKGSVNKQSGSIISCWCEPVARKIANSNQFEVAT